MFLWSISYNLFGEVKEMIKRGAKFRIKPYGVCVVESFDDVSEKYIMRCWNSSVIFYATKEEIEKGIIKRWKS